MENLTPSDNGNYTCIAKNNKGAINHTISLEVTIELSSPPIMSGGLVENWTVYEGESIQFGCSFKTGPEARILWFKIEPNNLVEYSEYEDNEDEILKENQVIMSGIKDGRYLVLNDVNKNDTAMYVCNATNFYGTSFKKFHLNVLQGNPKTKPKISIRY